MKRDWRKHLTEDERAQVEALEIRSAALTDQRKIVTAMLNMVRNRACQRARHADGVRQNRRSK